MHPHDGWSLQHGVVVFLGFSQRDVADGLQQPAIVEPVGPFQRHELDRSEGTPRRTPMDDLGLGLLARRSAPLTAFPCRGRSEEHTSELQSLMRISYAVFCLKKKNTYILCAILQCTKDSQDT